jgi:hypothetical protein
MVLIIIQVHGHERGDIYMSSFNLRFISDNSLKPYVEIWLEVLFSVKFAGREEIIRQINNAWCESYGDFDYLDIFFKDSVDDENNMIGMITPVTMLAKQSSGVIVVFLLHLNKKVRGIEIYTADGSTLDRFNIGVSDVEIEIHPNAKIE